MIRPNSPRRVFLTVTAGFFSPLGTAGAAFTALAAGAGLEGFSSAQTPERAWTQKSSWALKGYPWARA